MKTVNSMHNAAHILIALSLVTLTACTSQPVKEQQTVIPTTSAVPTTSPLDPPLTLIKDGKTLNMVRVMDGAACKDEYQGVKGTFLLYAEPSDIERIKREKGSKVFADFENRIQTLATDALQHATDATNFAEDPFALGAEEARQKLASQLSQNFQQSIDNEIKRFYQETTLMIDIVTFQPSLTFYQKGCEATILEPDEQPAPQK